MELNGVTATATLLEVAFHDNAEDAKWIVDKMDQIADAIVTGICEY
ncbi:MAG: N-acetylmuramoyl-L-alanine amidase [Lachnospiraceae bacterium]|nr:N-acetylmuramoyl-L-alanine amidase [Lachnospiraceae bacterium]